MLLQDTCKACETCGFFREVLPTRYSDSYTSPSVLLNILLNILARIFKAESKFQEKLQQNNSTTEQ